MRVDARERTHTHAHAHADTPPDHTHTLCPLPPTNPATTPQVCGGFPDSMACCAQLVQEQCSVDFVDINFGCPIDVVCG